MSEAFDSLKIEGYGTPLQKVRVRVNGTPKLMHVIKYLDILVLPFCDVSLRIFQE